MFSELTNLLPSELLAALRRDYYLRLAVVGVVTAAVLVIIHAVLLLPSYFYMQQQISVQKDALAQLSKAKVSDTENQINQQIANLSSEASYLSTLPSSPTASDAVRAILQVPHSGVSITGFTFGTQQGSQPTLQIQGTASTRDALRAYDQSLSTLPGVTNVDLPISDYAKASDIVFTLTITGTLKPQ